MAENETAVVDSDESPRGKGKKPSKGKTISHARDIFTATIAHHGGTTSPEGLAMQCFVYAAAFEKAEGQFQNDTLILPPKIDVFDIAHAPNLPETHPTNMVSQKYGKIEDILETMDDLSKLDRTDWGKASSDTVLYPKRKWTRPMINQAEQLFPGVLTRAERLKKAQQEVDEQAAETKAAASN